MSFDSLLVQTVSIVTPGTTTDRYGNTVPDWSTASSTTARAWISQRDRSENPVGREAEIGDWVAFFPPDTSITGRDRVTWNGVTFDVVGPPLPAWTPRALHHWEVTLRAVDG